MNIGRPRKTRVMTNRVAYPFSVSFHSRIENRDGLEGDGRFSDSDCPPWLTLLLGVADRVPISVRWCGGEAERLDG